MSYTGTYMKQEIWTSFGYKTGREEDRSSPILGVPMQLRKHLSGLRNAFKKWTYKKLRLLPQKKADAWMAGSDGRTLWTSSGSGTMERRFSLPGYGQRRQCWHGRGKQGRECRKQYYDTFLKKYHGEQSGAESEGRE